MSVAEKCLHFSMTECSRGRRRRQKRVNIKDGERFSVYDPDIIGNLTTKKIWKIILWLK